MEIKGDHYKYILSLSKEVHDEPIRLSDQGQVEKAESSPLFIRESTISSVEPMRQASQPKFLLLSSTLPFAFAGIWLGADARCLSLPWTHLSTWAHRCVCGETWVLPAQRLPLWSLNFHQDPVAEFWELREHSI